MERWEWNYEKFQRPLKKYIATLDKLGYTKDIPNIGGGVHSKEIDTFLCPGTWHPPSDVDSHKHVSTAPLFQVVLGSQTNVQVCSSQGAVCYVTKYVTKAEEGRQCMTKAEKDAIRIEAKDQYNMARTSSRIAEEKIRAKKGQGNPLFMEVTSPQMSMHVLDCPYHITNVEFTFASTFPLESRRAGLKVSGGSKVLDHQHNLIPVQKKEALNNAERQFLPDQQVLMEDFADGQFTVDATTSYSLRPPELLQFTG